MSSKSWKYAAEMLKREAAKPPSGCQALEQIAEEMGVSPDKAQETVSLLVKTGRAELVRGKRLTFTGALVTANYYRLVGTK